MLSQARQKYAAEKIQREEAAAAAFDAAGVGAEGEGAASEQPAFPAATWQLVKGDSECVSAPDSSANSSDDELKDNTDDEFIDWSLIELKGDAPVDESSESPYCQGDFLSEAESTAVAAAEAEAPVKRLTYQQKQALMGDCAIEALYR